MEHDDAPAKGETKGRELEVLPDAAADIESAAVWYEKQRAGLGLRFLDAVDDAASRVQRAPRQFAPFYRGTRRARLRRFPYQLIFRNLPGKILIIACLHFKRRPMTWVMRR